MAEPTGRGATAAEASVWVRRCRSCGRDDLSTTFGQLVVVTGPWSCPVCDATDHEAVRRQLPSATTSPGCPRAGTA